MGRRKQTPSTITENHIPEHMNINIAVAPDDPVTISDAVMTAQLDQVNVLLDGCGILSQSLNETGSYQLRGKLSACMTILTGIKEKMVVR